MAGHTDDARFRRFLWQSYWVAVAMYSLTYLAGWYAVQDLPEGDTYILRSRGWGTLVEFLVVGVWLGMLSLFYTLPSLLARWWISLGLRGVMFLLFVVALVIFQGEKAVAVVATPTSFVFVRPAPFGSREVPYHQLPEPRVRTTPFVTAMSLRGFPLVYPVDCKPVWHGDTAGQATLERLTTAIQHARPKPTKIQLLSQALRASTPGTPPAAPAR